eukprot:Anaeramoba_flamelloidesa81_46.p1 GENE.a81_46~~a81_46.p1  ORF type:complete len:775 (-),score=164.80 a81_46:343-2505(-)
MLTPKYLLHNQTKHKFKIYQKDCKIYEYLTPFHEKKYYWENLSKQRILIIQLINPNGEISKKSTKKINLDIPESRYEEKIGKYFIDFRVYKVGPTSCLTLSVPESRKVESSYEIKTSKKKLTRSIKFDINFQLRGLGVNLLSSTEDLIYFQISKIKLLFQDSTRDQSFFFSIDRIQMDNQQLIQNFPVIVEQKPLQVERKILSINYHKYKFYQNVDYYTNFSFLLQSLVFNIEEDFINLIFYVLKDSGINELLNRLSDQKESQGNKNNIDNNSSSNVGLGSSRSRSGSGSIGGNNKGSNKCKLQKTLNMKLLEKRNVINNLEKYESVLDKYTKNIYFENFIIYPIHLNINFEMGKRSSINPIKNFFRVLGTSFVSIHDQNILLYALQLSHCSTFPELLIDMFNHHYKTQFLQQAYKILTGSDIIGAPISIFKGIGQGMATFWEEPSKTKISTPLDFASSLQRGSYDAVSNVFNSVFGTLNKVVSSVGTGFSVLSFDHDFQNQRTKSSHQQKPKHVGDGLVQGTSKFTKDVWLGISGIVTQPMKGYKKRGKSGIVSGFGKGVIGVVAKPIVGITELISNVSDGITSSSTKYQPKSKGRTRLPRDMKNGILVPYDSYNALLQYVLQSNKKLVNEKIIFCYSCYEKLQIYLLLSENNIIFIKNKLIEKIYKRINFIDIFYNESFSLIFHFKQFKMRSVLKHKVIFDSEKMAKKIFEYFKLQKK